MRKFVSIIILIFVLTMAACSKHGTQSDAFDLEKDSKSENARMLDEGVWPENEYTDGLPVPSGTVSWAILDTANGYCSINLEDISEEEYNVYMEQLKEAGISVTNEVSEEVDGQSYVSIGTIMSDGERGLSISFIPGYLGIYISFTD